MNEPQKLFQISCKHCGAAVGFDIPTQTYRCASCGSIADSQYAQAAWNLPDSKNEDGLQIRSKTMECDACGATMEWDTADAVYRCAWCGTEVEAPKGRELPWKALNEHSWDTVQRQEDIAACTRCGARVLFKKDEASETCGFCGSNLVRSALQDTEELPQLIIPFVLTEEEARERLSQWAKKQKANKDTRRVEQNIKELKGYYLPYRMIRGPLEGIAYRDQMSKEYKYKGFLEHAVINTSRQLDNQVLDELEPFDLSALRPFEPGYIGGHRVKLGDVSQAQIQQRTLEEAMDNYRPYVAQVLQNDDVEMQVTSGEFLHLPILLPVYVQKVGKYLAVVNGQTGKVAVASSETPRESKRWLIEPTVLTFLAVLAAGWAFKFMLYPMLLAGSIAALVFYTAFGDNRNHVRRRRIYNGKASRASRENGALRLEEGDNILKNALPNTPAFYESDGTREAHVELKFYTPGRILGLAVKLIVFIFLPALIAIMFNRGIQGLAFEYGAAWYVTTGGIAIIYWIRGVRWDIYNHPILYEVLPDGKRKLFGSKKSRKLSMLALFGLNTREEQKKLGGVWYMIVGFMIFVLLGSTMAILF